MCAQQENYPCTGPASMRYEGPNYAYSHAGIDERVSAHPQPKSGRKCWLIRLLLVIPSCCSIYGRSSGHVEKEKPNVTTSNEFRHYSLCSFHRLSYHRKRRKSKADVAKQSARVLWLNGDDSSIENKLDNEHISALSGTDRALWHDKTAVESISSSENILYTLLLPPLVTDEKRKSLVLDLDETLVHSSFKMISNADFTIPVEVDGIVHDVYVIKRPGLEEFLKEVGSRFELIIFTASMSKYADPVISRIDEECMISHRLFREHCAYLDGTFVKDLGKLGRDLKGVIIMDNSPASYILHPQNAVPISSWFNDPHDTELLDVMPFLRDLAEVPDVSEILDQRMSDSFC